MEPQNPYAAPQAPIGDRSVAAGAAYVPLDQLGRRAAISVVCVPAFSVATHLTRLIAGPEAEGHPPGIAVALLLLVAFAGLVAAVVSAPIFFCIWIHRAERNLRGLGRTMMEYTPARAVSSFFIPFVSFVRPLRVVGELWRASDPAPSADGRGWRTNVAPPLVQSWWGALIVSGFIGNGTRSPSSRASSEDAAISTFVWLIGSGLMAFAAFACVVLMRDIGARQARAAERLHGGSADDT